LTARQNLYVDGLIMNKLVRTHALSHTLYGYCVKGCGALAHKLLTK
jgi:hypothetical protein